jgi:hypothetical protein
MQPQVDFEGAGCEETFAALVALVGSDPAVAPHVVHERVPVGEHPITFSTVHSSFLFVFTLDQRGRCGLYNFKR